MKLETLVNELDYTLIQGTLDQNVSQIDYDSRTVQSESLFVCIKGANVDGHRFINQAILQGAKTIVIEDEVDYQEGITYIKVKDSHLALALLSAAYFDYPSRKLTVIGITGTKGKTTATYMIYSILQHAHKKAGIIGTIESLIDGQKKETKNTTPQSYELQKLMKEMVDAGCEYCVLEVSSQGLKLERVAGIDFDYGVFTNLAPDHIGPHEHASFEEYKECKKKLFKMCKVGLFNKDDDYYGDMIENASCQVLSYSISQSSDLQAKDVHLYRRDGNLGVSFKTKGLVDGSFETDIPGYFSVYNSLVAIMICLLIGIDKEPMKKALKQVRVKGRVEIVPYNPDFTVLIDYAHNAFAFSNILETIKAYKPHRIICVYGAGGKKAQSRRGEVGKVVAKMGAFSILTADNPRGEDIRSICENIAQGIQEYKGDYIIIEDRQKAIEYALDMAQKDDVVLCLGKGHEDYMIYDAKHTVHFSEREIIENYRDK